MNFKFIRVLFLLVCNIIAFQFSEAQQPDSVRLYLMQDTVTMSPLDEVSIFINRKKSPQVKYQHAGVKVERGEIIDIVFYHEHYIMDNLNNLRVYSDTVIYYNSANLLPTVLVKPKKTSMTLEGFTYYPQRDTPFLKQPLFYSLQRMPFISIVDEDIKYKNEGKIWYRVNGKDRPGLTSNWNQLLKSLRTENILKVELVTELPEYIKRQGYSALINILILEDNLRGITLNVASVINQRLNFNHRISLSGINKKLDYSFSLSDNQDNYEVNNSVEVKHGDALIMHTLMKNDMQYKNQTLDLKLGARIDSSKEWAVGLNIDRYKRNDSWDIVNGAVGTYSDYNNHLNRLNFNINASYLYRKAKNIESAVLVEISNEEEKLTHDLFQYNVLRKTSGDYLQALLEYYYINTSLKKFRYEYGVQIYTKKLTQDYKEYDLNLLKYNKPDTMNIIQHSIRPYYKFAFVKPGKEIFTINLNAELFNLKLPDQSNLMVLPSISIRKKKVNSGKNTSHTITSSFSFLKASNEFYKSIHFYINPVESKIGQDVLKPSKRLELKYELIKSEKSDLSNEFGGLYSFDMLNFYTTYDSISKTTISRANNDNKSITFFWRSGLSFSIKSKFFASIYPQLIWRQISNRSLDEGYSGLQFSGNLSCNYTLPRKIGRVGFNSFCYTNIITAQGNQRGLVKYSLYMSKSFFRNKIIISTSASNFFLKNRTDRSVMTDGAFDTFSQSTYPFRYIDLRVAYRFSNIKNGKYSTLKKTSGLNEVSP